MLRPTLSVIVLACCLAFADGRAQAQDMDSCSAECPLGMRCNADGLCVRDPDADAPVQRGSELEAEKGDGAYEHDGMLVRVTLGPSAAFLTERADVGVLSMGISRVEQAELRVSGAALAFGLDVGHALGTHFAWQVRLSQCVLPDPKLEGESLEGRGDTTRTLAMLGPGLSWFGPVGLYAAAAVGIAFTRTQRYEGEGGLGDAGLGANLDLGVETWIAEQFALGGALRGWWSNTSANSAGGERSQRALAIGAALSVTYQ